MDIYFWGGDTLIDDVPKRPRVSAPKFGKWLELQRGDRSFEQIARKIRPLVERAGLKVEQSNLKKFEQGRIPNWPVLIALAHVYGVPMNDMMQRLGAAIDFPGRRDVAGDTRVQETDTRDSERVRNPTTDAPDRDLLIAAPHRADRAGTNLAETRAAIERILGDLTAIAEQLPRGQTAMAGRSGSGSAARPRRRRRQSHRKTHAETSSE